MRQDLQFTASQVAPEVVRILQQEGAPLDSPAARRLTPLIEQACGVLHTFAAPRGVFQHIAPQDFCELLEGMGRNCNPNPITLIAGRAHAAALFGFTLGKDICSEITRLFAQHDYAQAYLLDRIASQATEIGAQLLEDHYKATLDGAGQCTLRYSPGYCGWDISGQVSVFDALRLRKWGIDLNSSYLMEPLKSITGVFLGGPPQIHIFKNNYPFCKQCRDHTCRERIRGITGP